MEQRDWGLGARTLCLLLVCKVLRVRIVAADLFQSAHALEYVHHLDVLSADDLCRRERRVGGWPRFAKADWMTNTVGWRGKRELDCMVDLRRRWDVSLRRRAISNAKTWSSHHWTPLPSKRRGRTRILGRARAHFEKVLLSMKQLSWSVNSCRILQVMNRYRYITQLTMPRAGLSASCSQAAHVCAVWLS